MTFNDKEYSTDDAAPYEIYEFVRGTWVMRLTTKDTELYISDNEIYQPAPISRDKIRQGEEIRKDTITLTIPRGHALASEFISIAPESTTTVTIRRLHRGLDIGEAIVVWKGRITGAQPRDEKVELSCESVYTSMRLHGLRLRAELICQHSLYDQYCKADQPAKRVDDTIATMTSPTILEMNSISGTYTDGWFSGGILDYNQDSRFIVSHSGSTLRISRPLPGLAVGSSVALYPGCSRTISACRDKFNNLNNFLGFPWMPQENPFQVSIKT